MGNSQGWGHATLRNSNQSIRYAIYPGGHTHITSSQHTKTTTHYGGLNYYLNHRGKLLPIPADTPSSQNTVADNGSSFFEEVHFLGDKTWPARSPSGRPRASTISRTNVNIKSSTSPSHSGFLPARASTKVLLATSVSHAISTSRGLPEADRPPSSP